MYHLDGWAHIPADKQTLSPNNRLWFLTITMNYVLLLYTVPVLHWSWKIVISYGCQDLFSCVVIPVILCVIVSRMAPFMLILKKVIILVFPVYYVFGTPLMKLQLPFFFCFFNVTYETKNKAETMANSRKFKVINFYCAQK